MKLEIDDGDSTRNEHISDGDQALLRAAYVAVLLKNDLTSTFGQGQINIFRGYLNPNKGSVPRNIITDAKFLDLLDHWFEGRLLESLKPYKDDESVVKPVPFTRLCQKIRITAGVSEDKQNIVTAWLIEETLEATASKIRRILLKEQ